jgi:GH15 family glucan-1,4-alpha-glucosidase
LILETEIETADGAVRLIDFMPPRGENPDIVRIIEGLRGNVRMKMDLIIRFDYGHIIPWVRKKHGGLEAIAGPDALILRTPIETRGEDLTTVAEFDVAQGGRVPFVLTWFASHGEPPRAIHPEHALQQTEDYWMSWSKACRHQGPWREAVVRSLITLKGLTYAPTGGIVAAPTMSLPEWIGGVRNWDYRYCWLRDATFTLYAFLVGGYTEEALAWRNWLLRAVAGDPADLQIMYGPAGERRLTELEIPWLPGYEGSRPVREGNAAVDQLQLDVYGEVMDALHLALRSGVEPDPAAWELQLELMKFLEKLWQEPDEGIWEVRGPRRHFTHSKVMAWVAFDRAIKSAEEFHPNGAPLERWRNIRNTIHAQVCSSGYDPVRKTFVQYYGAQHVDASLLMLPLVGFLPARDPRVLGTVAAIEKDLMRGGFLLRYPADARSEEVDGLPAGEGVFLPCTFWLADNYALQGRDDAARQTFERLLALRNDLGLLSEEYDPRARRLLGNFPQAFSHVSLINSARNVSHTGGPAADRHAHTHETHPQPRADL